MVLKNMFSGCLFVFSLLISHGLADTNMTARFTCYNWAEIDKPKIGGSSLATQQSYCENDLGHKWSYGDDSLAPGCGQCWCCEKNERFYKVHLSNTLEYCGSE
eukprot:GFUD01068750.1.p1 GENE.GFUD01068750.1~~GFUD01068750.1.p1  ORF type:complete len:103 (-),score=18.81 GFUD01068750.1:302-610(-)